MKNFIIRYKVIVLALALVVSIGAWQRSVLAENGSTPPTKVIVTNAAVTDQGVEIEWLAAQPGTNPIDTYLIQKRSQNGAFTTIDQVGADSLSYIDTSGKAGDAYKIIAEDNQDPATDSAPSDPAVATAEEPGSSVVVVPPDNSPASGNVDSTPTPPTGASDQPLTSDTIAPLQTSTAQHVAALDSAVSKNDTTKSQSALTSLQGAQQQILSSFPHLTTPQKQAFAKSCQQQLPILEPAVTLLPENNQVDGLLVLAGCDAIQGLTP